MVLNKLLWREGEKKGGDIGNFSKWHYDDKVETADMSILLPFWTSSRLSLPRKKPTSNGSQDLVSRLELLYSQGFCARVRSVNVRCLSFRGQFIMGERRKEESVVPILRVGCARHQPPE